MRKLLILLLRFYQAAISPWLGSRCRFAPSCSAYAVEALSTHSLGSAVWLSMCRVGRCHPWHPGGYDPVPEPSASSSKPSVFRRASSCCARHSSH